MPKRRTRRPKSKGKASSPVHCPPIVTALSPEPCDSEDTNSLKPLDEDLEPIEEKPEASSDEDGSLHLIDDDVTGEISKIEEGETLEHDGDIGNREVEIFVSESNVPLQFVDSELRQACFEPRADTQPHLTSDMDASTSHENQPSTSEPHADGKNDSHPPGKFNGQWSHLFADNRKSIEDFQASKAEPPHVWKPRNRKRPTVSQRIPSQMAKSNTSNSMNNASENDPQPQPASDLQTDLPEMHQGHDLSLPVQWILRRGSNGNASYYRSIKCRLFLPES
ncbi:hypothetical protein Dimus_020438, partial [Dionaea muscipula]